MKKIVTIAVAICLTWMSVFAQNVPIVSMRFNKECASMLCSNGHGQNVMAISKKLVSAGDVSFVRELYEKYPQGIGAEQDKREANRWLNIGCNFDSTQLPAQTKSPNIDGNGLDEAFRDSGALIADGAQLKNYAIITGLSGGVVGGILTGIGAAYGSVGFYAAGSVIIGGCAIAALVLDIKGNNRIKEGGRILQHISVSGNGMTFTF